MGRGRSTHRSFKALGASYLRGMALYAVVAIAALCLLAVMGLLAVPLGPLLNIDREWMFVAVLVLWMLVSLGVTLVIVVWMLVSRARKLDAAFTPLGLAGKMYLQNGRQYHGTIRGRRVDVYFYRGPTLEIFVEAPFGTRLGIGTRDSLAGAMGRLLNRAPLDLNDADYADFDIYPLDEHWSRELLSDPAAKDAVLRLAAAEGAYGVHQVIIAPDAISLRLRHTRVGGITADNVHQWVDDLLVLIDVAEHLPVPQQTAEPTALEQKTRTRRGSFAWWGVLVALALVGVPSCIAVVVALVLIALSP